MERRVLIHAPRGRDADVIQGLLQGLELVAVVCASADALIAQLDQGAAAAIVTEESLLKLPEAPLRAWLMAQPSWSDFPFILLATRQAGKSESPA